MKKPVLIATAAAGLLVTAVIGAVVYDVVRRGQNSTPSPSAASTPAPGKGLKVLDGDAGIQALIAQLGDADGNKRDEASEQLKKLGAPALPALQRAAQGASEEIGARAKTVITSINGGDSGPAVQGNPVPAP